MTIETILTSYENAGILQDHCTEYDCTVNVSVTSENKAKVTIGGEQENVEKLLNLIGAN